MVQSSRLLTPAPAKTTSSGKERAQGHQPFVAFAEGDGQIALSLRNVKFIQRNPLCNPRFKAEANERGAGHDNDIKSAGIYLGDCVLRYYREWSSERHRGRFCDSRLRAVRS